MRSMAPSGRRPRARILATAAVAAAALAGLGVLGAGQAFARTVACGEAIANSTRVDSDLVNCPGTGS